MASGNRVRDRARVPLAAMIGLTALDLLGLPIGLGIMAFGAMTGDGGMNGFTLVLALVAGAVPVSMVVGPVGAWVSWRLFRRRWTWWWLTLPWQLVLALGVMVSLALAME